jgi:hypothetical protein
MRGKVTRPYFHTRLTRPNSQVWRGGQPLDGTGIGPGRSVDLLAAVALPGQREADQDDAAANGLHRCDRLAKRQPWTDIPW